MFIWITFFFNSLLLHKAHPLFFPFILHIFISQEGDNFQINFVTIFVRKKNYQFRFDFFLMMTIDLFLTIFIFHNIFTKFFFHHYCPIEYSYFLLNNNHFIFQVVSIPIHMYSNPIDIIHMSQTFDIMLKMKYHNIALSIQNLIVNLMNNIFQNIFLM